MTELCAITPAASVTGGTITPEQREADLGQLLTLLVEAQGHAQKVIDKARSPKLLDLYDRYGVRAPQQWEISEWGDCGSDDARAYTTSLSEEGAALVCADDDLAEIGAPGTPFLAGQLVIEGNHRRTPRRMRGTLGGVSWARYDELMREPVVYKSLQSIKELLVSGQWRMSVPKECASEDREYVEWCASWLWTKLQQHDEGWDRYIEDLATAISHGVVTHEVVWRRDGVLAYPSKLAFREPSTIDRWLMDDRQRDLLGVAYATGGDKPQRYTLSACGPTLLDRRVLVTSVGRRGNNYEGLPPLRVVDALVSIKQLLWAIVGASYERFGCPILTVSLDVSALDAFIRASGGEPDKAKLQRFVRKLELFKASDTPTTEVPEGLKLEYIGPGGEMPDVLAIIQYLDSQIREVFSTQSMGLGLDGAGSYALADVQDDDFSRSIPYYARVLMAALNDLCRKIFRVQFGLELAEYPRIVWAPRTSEDTSRWVTDVVSVHSAADTMPPAVRGAVLERLGLPEDAYGMLEDDEDAPTREPLNGAQMDKLLVSVQSYNAGLLSQHQAARVIALALGITIDEATSLLGERLQPPANPEGIV